MGEVELALPSSWASSWTDGCCRHSLMRGSTECAGMGDERRDDDAERRARANVYASARIGAAAPRTLVLVVLLVDWSGREG